MTAHIQQSTCGGSTVIKSEPTTSNGVATVTINIQNAVRAPVSRARKRRTMKLRMAANTGEKKRTPKSVSPPMNVPAR